jgi:hypothetical protein
VRESHVRNARAQAGHILHLDQVVDVQFEVLLEHPAKLKPQPGSPALGE